MLKRKKKRRVIKEEKNIKEDALFCVGQKAFIEKCGKVLVLFDPVEGLIFPEEKYRKAKL